MRARVIPKQSDREGQQHAAATDGLRRDANQLPFLTGQLIQNVLVKAANGTQQVSHTLGVVPRGFIVVNQIGGSGHLTLSASDNKTITFANGGMTDVTADIWVY